MKNLILLSFIPLLLFNCKRSETKKTDIPEMARDSAVVIVDTLPRKSDAEILKEQAEFEKESSKIVNKFTEKRTANGFVYELFCEEEKSGMINFQFIEVFKNNKLIQKIKVDSVLVYHRNEVMFEVDKDVNFDGENDIQLVNWVGMHATDISYSFYIYDKNISKYIHNPFLDDITNLNIDYKNKTIVSQYFTRVVDQNEEIYKWKNKKLILISGYITNPYTGEVEKYHVKNGKRITD